MVSKIPSNSSEMKETVKRNLGGDCCLLTLPTEGRPRLQQGLETETDQFYPPRFRSFPGGGKVRLYLVVDFVGGWLAGEVMGHLKLCCALLYFLVTNEANLFQFIEPL